MRGLVWTVPSYKQVDEISQCCFMIGKTSPWDCWSDGQPCPHWGHAQWGLGPVVSRSGPVTDANPTHLVVPTLCAPLKCAFSVDRLLPGWKSTGPGQSSETYCRGPAPARSRGYPQDERRRREREKTRETSLDRAKSAREGGRESDRVTRRGVQSLAQSGNALFFTIAFIP